MKQLIDELKAIPGVVGACIYSSRDGLKATNLPGIFKADRLASVGKQLSKLQSAGRMSFDDLTDISLHYDESVVVVRGIEKKLLIFVICDPSFNHNLLTMSFNLLQEELREGEYLDSEENGSSITTEALVAAIPDERLIELLGEMKGKLGKYLGPMAGFIFDEAVEAWEEQGPAERTRINSLIDLVNKEIGTPDKIDGYRRLIDDDLRQLI